MDDAFFRHCFDVVSASVTFTERTTTPSICITRIFCLCYHGHNVPPPITNVRNIKPRNRNSSNSDGRNVHNTNSRFGVKDVIEKKRLKERSFGHIRYSGDVIDDPINPIQNAQRSLSYSNDIERFNTDISDFNVQQKHQRLSQKELKIAHLTQERLERDQQRWDHMNMQYEAEENKVKQLHPIKNNPSMPYDPITLRYDDSLDGKRLEFSDKQSIYRAKLREQRLFEKQTSGFDPLTGQIKQYSKKITPPVMPTELKDRPF